MTGVLFKGGIVPFGCCLILFFGINTLMNRITGFDNLNDMFAAFFGYAFKFSPAVSAEELYDKWSEHM